MLMNLSLLTGRPFLFPDIRGVSVHISFTFSRTMLQCRSKAFTRAKSLRLLRQEMRTWVCERTAVWRMERGPEVNSCSSRRVISYSLSIMDSVSLESSTGNSVRNESLQRSNGVVSVNTYVRSDRGLFNSSLKTSVL